LTTPLFRLQSPVSRVLVLLLVEVGEVTMLPKLLVAFLVLAVAIFFKFPSLL
jgi:hypothetical protein